MATRFWPNEDPIGHRITIGEMGADSALVYRTVVGVAKNVRHCTLREPSRIQVYVPVRQTLARYGGLAGSSMAARRLAPAAVLRED